MVTRDASKLILEGCVTPSMVNSGIRDMSSNVSSSFVGSAMLFVFPLSYPGPIYSNFPVVATGNVNLLNEVL